MTLLLMAAGRGSRYGKLKQFDDLGPEGEFLMEFSIYGALESGFDHIVVITQKDNIDFLRKHLQERLPQNIQLDVLSQELTDLPEGASFSGEREKPWGTAHAVWSARNVIKNAFVVINADDFYGKSAYQKAAEFIQYNKGPKDFALVGYPLKDTLSEHGPVSRGICKVDPNNILISVDERTEIEQQESVLKDQDSGLEFNGNELASMNFWICQPSIFSSTETQFREFLKHEEQVQKGEIYLPFVIQQMKDDHEAVIRALPSDSEWFGVTYASDKEKAIESLLRKTKEGQYPSPLWN
ncbi:hypothetical protein MNBD_BACTEROID03-2247 [hydrothermal vent metagenome]|uniref:Nucleotidyl transferase domain-containing protein n=1 Tax=hydrothermal vent metagenome TaxID=652676 RepID=A0A3B0TLT9_9ZZZZ